MNLANLFFTRRTGVRMLAGAAVSALLRRGSAADLESPGKLTWDAVPAPGSEPERRYRATAQILILSLPLVRWPNVGGGSALWRESAAPHEGKLRYLEFTGFSNPQRAAGLNRLGFIRELSRVADGAAADSLYFGLMTASPEETAEEARRALHPKGKEAAYTAIDGRLTNGSIETVVAHFTAPANWSVANQKELIQLARAALMMTPPRPPEGSPGTSAIRPFLQTLAEGLRQPGNTEARFAYAGRLYRLVLEKEPDAKAAANFQQRGLIPPGTPVVRASGKVRRETGGKESPFRVWVPQGAPQPLPLRIEYQAKSYLRLIFDAQS
jgi:hypothetical protein